MLMPRGLVFLLIYTGLLLAQHEAQAGGRGRDRDRGEDGPDAATNADPEKRDRGRRRKEERRQRHREQEKASSSLIEAIESHHNKYSAADNEPEPPRTSRTNQTTVIQPYVINQKYDHPKPDDIQVGCKELRSKRYISDGFCTSVKPITEVVCTGHCLPIRNLPWYAEFIKVWARTKVLEWRCVEDDIRRKRVSLQCENGETRSYRIKVVKSCKCKRYMKLQNQSIVRLRGGGAGGGAGRRSRRNRNRKRRRKDRKENLSPDHLLGARTGDL